MNQVTEILDAVAKLPRSRRKSKIAEMCQGDSTLESQVRAILPFYTTCGIDTEGDVLGDIGLFASVEPGARIGEHEIVKELGGGGMGIVYEARRLIDNSAVAIKLMHAWVAGSDAACQRFAREARALERLDHPGIVKFHHYGEHLGRPYLVMDLVRGTPLDQVVTWKKDHTRVANPPIAPPGVETDPARWVEFACELIRRVADALAAAHVNGIVHRDVKPSNIVLRSDGYPLLTDFGIARASGEPTLTGSREFLGTPYFAAPECYDRRFGEIGVHSDLYSLGVVLFELLTLDLPFRGVSQWELERRILNEEAPALRSRLPKVNRDLDTICSRLLEKEPKRRFISANALHDDLARLLRGERIAARRASPIERGVRWSKRNRWAAAFVAMSALAAGGALKYALEQRRANDEILRQQSIVRSTLAQSSMSAAREADRFGRLDDALRLYDEALAFGYPDTVAVELGQIAALSGQYRSQDALIRLRALARRPDLGAHRSKVLLMLGTLNVNRFANPDVGVDEIRQALAIGGLEPADEEFAKAIVAPNVGDLIDGLREAVRHDRMHRMALMNLTPLLILFGRLDEARIHGAQYLALSPRDPLAGLLMFMIDALKSPTADFSAELKSLALPREFESGVEAFLEVRSMIQQFVNDATASGDDSRFGMLKSYWKLSELISKALEPMERDPAVTGMQLQITLPPAVTRAFRHAVKVIGEIVLRDAADPKLLHDLDVLVESCPIAFFFLVRSAVHHEAGLYRDAETDLTLIQPMPSFISVRKVAITGTIAAQRAQFAKLDPRATAERTALLKRYRETFMKFIALPNPTTSDLEFLSRANSVFADPPIDGAISMLWNEHFPDDPRAVEFERKRRR